MTDFGQSTDNITEAACVCTLGSQGGYLVCTTLQVRPSVMDPSVTARLGGQRPANGADNHLQHSHKNPLFLGPALSRGSSVSSTGLHWYLELIHFKPISHFYHFYL